MRDDESSKVVRIPYIRFKQTCVSRVTVCPTGICLATANLAVIEEVRMQRSMRAKKKRRVGAIAVSVLVAGLGPLLLATPGQTQVPYAQASIKASATGTVVHAGALQSGATRLLDGEVAFSGAAYDSQGLTQTLLNEMQRPFAPVNASKLSSGRASGLEVGLGVTPKDPNQLILAGEADASSPPSGPPVTKEIGPVPAGPLAWASVLRGTADANAVPSVCALGTDLSNGTAFAADAQLLDAGKSTPTGLQSPVLAADAPTPDRAVSNSVSRTLFVSQRDSKGKLQGPDFGVMSEVRETIAPVTFFKGTPNQFTIEVLGEWVLQTVATGLPGGAYVHYGPEKASPSTPILRVIQSSGTQTFSFQDVFGSKGLVITIPGVAEIAIGEDPRAIGGSDTSSPETSPGGTKTSAAVDVARVRSLPNAPGDIEDVRVGHMEASALVPAGGVACPLPITKIPSVSSVNVGGTFTTTFTVNNPFQCTLKNVSITDDVTTDGLATFSVDSTDPTAAVTGGGKTGTISWTGLGDIKPGKSETVSAVFGAHGGTGHIIDIAKGSAKLADCGTPGATVAGVDVSVTGAGLSGSSPLVSVPVGVQTAVAAAVATPPSNAAVAPEVAKNSGELPRSGRNILILVATGFLLIAAGAVAIKTASYGS